MSTENLETMGPEEETTTRNEVEMDEELEEEEVGMTDEERALAAEKRKEEGNKYYIQKKYVTAIKCYTEAIDLCPTCAAYYGNRAASYIMLHQHEKALSDARTAIRIDPKFVKGHLREAKCHLVMGEPRAAISSYSAVLQLEPTHNIALTELEHAKQQLMYLEQAEVSYQKGDFRHVLFCMERSLLLAPACTKLKVTKAECLALLKRYQEAQEIANDILRTDIDINPDAVYVRGLCLYYQDNVEKAFQHFQQVLRLAPDHTKAKDVYRKAKSLTKMKEQGNQAFRNAKLQEAHDLYTQALNIDPFNVFTNSKLYANRATVCCKINKPHDAIADCTKAIALDESYIKAYLRRAKCYLDTEQYDEAVRDYEKIYKMDKSREHRQLLQESKLEQKKSKRKDFYKILGVGKNATEDEIKKAYRKRALLHHPDRHSGATDEFKKGEEKKFKEIGEAYTILSDAKKKARYDSGQDLEDLEGPGGFHDVDPNMIFQTFFGGGGGGMPGGYSFSQSGFPSGGFQFQFG